MAVPNLARGMRYLVVAGAAGAAVLPAGVALADSKASKDFDPEAYERAAKALREIKNSPFAKQVGARARSPRAARGCAA